MNNLDSYNIISKEVGKINFLTWAGLRHAIPSHLKMGNYTFMSSPPSLVINDKDFNQRTITLKDEVKGLSETLMTKLYRETTDSHLAPFFIPKPSTSVYTVYTRSPFGKSLNVSFILFQKNLSLLL